MEAYRHWLPEAAVERGAREVALRGLVADWSSKWFASGQAKLATEPSLGPITDRDGDSFWLLADGLVLILSAAFEQTAIAMLFGTPDPGGTPTAADRTALEAVTGSCLADLRARLAGAFRLPPDTPWRPVAAAPDGPHWLWRVHAPKGVPLLCVAAPGALVIGRVRAGLPPLPRPNDLSSLAVAMAGQTVSLSALVGRCRLTTAELGGLAEGDVVVLDRTLGSPVEIAIEHHPKPLFCAIAEQDGRLNFTLVDGIPRA